MPMWSAVLALVALSGLHVAQASRLTGRPHKGGHKSLLRHAASVHNAQLNAATCVEAVLVETRSVKSIALAIESAARLEDGSGQHAVQMLTLAHGNRNGDYVRRLVEQSEILREAESEGRVRLVKLDVDDLGGDRGPASFSITEDALKSYGAAAKNGAMVERRRELHQHHRSANSTKSIRGKSASAHHGTAPQRHHYSASHTRGTKSHGASAEHSHTRGTKSHGASEEHHERRLNRHQDRSNHTRSGRDHQRGQRRRGLSHLQMEYHNRYSQLLFRKDFWEQMKCDHVLVMQSDTLLCPNSKAKLAEFLDYDFIGGETPQMHDRILHGVTAAHMNGGLSLRKREAMLKCLSRKDMHPGKGMDAIEDSFFNRCPDIAKRPTIKVMDMFAIDNGLKPVHEVPFGMHKPWAGRFRAENVKACHGASDLQRANHP